MERRTICVDFDGTLFPWDEDLWADNPPEPGAIKAMRSFHSLGYQIMIFSSRLSDDWVMSTGENIMAHHDHMEKLLHKYEVPFDGFAWDKIKADYYIDDRAIEYKGDWDAIRERVEVSR
jgi:histidinol phosphatase-like enzyme